MRIIVTGLLAILLSIPLGLIGQAEQIPELEASLASATGKGRINLLLRLGELEIEANDSKKQAKHFQRAIQFLEEGVKLAQNPPFEDLEAEFKGLELLVVICQKNNAENRTIGQLKNKCKQVEDDRNLAMEKLAEKLEANFSKASLDLERSESKNYRITAEKDQVQQKLDLSQEEILLQDIELAEAAKEKAEAAQKIAELASQQSKLKAQTLELENELLVEGIENGQLQSQQRLLLIGLVSAVLIALLFLRNYSLEKKRAAEKAKMQHQLLVQDKMATLGQLAVGIAHEIKNPLNFVNNFAEGSSSLSEELLETLLDNKDKVPADQYELMEEVVGEIKQNATDIAHHGQRADRIVKSMMEHARGEMGSLEPTDINRLLADNIALAFNGYRGIHPDFNTDIQKDFAPSLPLIEVIPQGLSRVFINILNNACYALHKKTQANLEAYEPILRVSTKAYEKGIEIRIYDNGIGIPSDIQTKIFNPFFTSKPTGDGNTGLGLYFSYDIIVQAHGGDLALKSEVGSYTEFIIKIPHILHLQA